MTLCLNQFIQQVKTSLNRVFFFFRVFFHEHSGFTGQQGKGEVNFFNSSLPLPPVSQALRYQPGDRRAHLCTKLAAVIELATFGFRVQVANHYATRPNIWLNKKLLCLLSNTSQLKIILSTEKVFGLNLYTYLCQIRLVQYVCKTFGNARYWYWLLLKEIPVQNQSVKNQNQPSEIFCKKSCSQKVWKIHMKSPVLKSLFNKVTSPQMFLLEFAKF